MYIKSINQIGYLGNASKQTSTYVANLLFRVQLVHEPMTLEKESRVTYCSAKLSSQSCYGISIVIIKR